MERQADDQGGMACHGGNQDSREVPMKVIVTTCDKYLWAIRPFAYLFNTYWSELQEVIVVGFKPPKFKLPPNFEFFSLGPSEYPANRWSNQVIDFLRQFPDSHFVWLLEDYWLNRRADNSGISTLHEYMQLHPEVLRIDLTTDRLYNGQMFEVESYGHYDIIETPRGSPYQMSVQAAIWNRKLLLALLRPNTSPWDVEMYTQPPASMRVLGTRQWPLRYANVFKGGEPGKALNLDKIPAEHRKAIEESKWLPVE